MTEEDIKELVEWSTLKVIEQMSHTERTYLAVRRLHAEGESDGSLIDYLIGQCKRDEYLMDNVFELLTGVRFDDINWVEVIDHITDRTEVDV